MRLDKFLSDMNRGTRKELKEKIKKGSVTVNGQACSDPGQAVTDTDEIVFDGKIVKYYKYEYYMMNKPWGVITATEDHRQKTVLDILGSDRRKDLFPVGRLDKDTVGLLLITNDGKLSHRLLSPKKHVDKEYYALIDGKITEKEIAAFKKGVRIEDDFTALPAELELLTYRNKAVENDFLCLRKSKAPKSDLQDGVSEIRVTIREGKFHQIKKMFHACGKEVIWLKRIRMGKLVLDSDLKEGEYRRLTEKESALLEQ